MTKPKTKRKGLFSFKRNKLSDIQKRTLAFRQAVADENEKQTKVVLTGQKSNTKKVLAALQSDKEAHDLKKANAVLEQRNEELEQELERCRQSFQVYLTPKKGRKGQKNEPAPEPARRTGARGQGKKIGHLVFTPDDHETSVSTPPKVAERGIAEPTKIAGPATPPTATPDPSGARSGARSSARRADEGVRAISKERTTRTLPFLGALHSFKPQSQLKKSVDTPKTQSVKKSTSNALFDSICSFNTKKLKDAKTPKKPSMKATPSGGPRMSDLSSALLNRKASLKKKKPVEQSLARNTGAKAAPNKITSLRSELRSNPNNVNILK